MVKKSKGFDHQQRRHWVFRTRIFAVSFCVALFVGLTSAQELEPPERRIPLMERDPKSAWRSQVVWQSRCGYFVQDQQKVAVSVIDSQDNLVRERYWVLNEAALGIVENVDVGDNGLVASVDVVFTGDIDDAKLVPTGWEPKNLIFNNVVEVDQQGQIDISRSSDGGLAIQTNEHREVKQREGYEVSGFVGRIIEKRGRSVVVRYSSDAGLSRRRPRCGEKVVRGPDWNGGVADGYVLDRWTQIPAVLEGRKTPFTGTVMEEGRGGNGLRVKWDRTDEVTPHRFGFGRYYDIQVISDVGVPADAEMPVLDGDREATP